jgi:hypothetical protein
MSRIMVPSEMVSRTIPRPSCEHSFIFTCGRRPTPYGTVVPFLPVLVAGKGAEVPRLLLPPYTSHKGMPELLLRRVTSLKPISPSTYLVTDYIPLYYYTEVIGDARNPPTILAAENFNSSALAIFGKLSPEAWKRKFLTGVANRRRSLHSRWERKSVVH